MAEPMRNVFVAHAGRDERLAAYLAANRRARFSLGHHDCVLFAVRWVDAELGTGYAMGVSRLVARIGGIARLRRAVLRAGEYERFATEVAGVAPERTLEWRPGDVAVFRQDSGLETLGILSSRLVHAPSADGLLSFDARHVVCHWGLECLRP